MGRHRKCAMPAKRDCLSTNSPAQSGPSKCNRTEAARNVARSSSAAEDPHEKVDHGGDADPMPVRSEVTKEEAGHSEDVAAKRICLAPGFFYSGRRRGRPKKNGLDGESSVSKHDSGGREDKNTKLPEQNVSLDSGSGLGGKESEMECSSTRGQSLDENGEKQLSSDEGRLQQPRRSLRCARIKRETPGDVYGLKSEADPCPICLRQMKGRVGTLESCAHAFCLPCIMKWSEANSSCPKDRIQYSEVLAHHHLGEPVYKRIPVEKKIPEDHPESDSSFESEFSFPPNESSEFEEFDESDDDDFFDDTKCSIHCEICGRRDYPFRFSTCSVCSASFHSRCYDVTREELTKSMMGELVCENCEEEEGRN